MIKTIAVVLVLTLIHNLYALENDHTQNDLVIPKIIDQVPRHGKRVKIFHKKYLGTQIYHSLYLPSDWQKEKKYPVIVEYAGNKWRDYPGTIEGCKIGFGISAGKGVIWLCLPYVDEKNKANAASWWGNIDATVAYCKKTVNEVCVQYGGDPAQVFIAGFSRGSIACNYIGLHDDEIASLWKGFICHSHYDGLRKWPYAESDKASAKSRLQRLAKRPQFINQEKSIIKTKQYLKTNYPNGEFTFLEMSFPQHSDTWVLKDCPERKELREWFWKTQK